MPGPGVYGPYQRRGSWILIIRAVGGGNGISRSFSEERLAKAAIPAWRAFVAAQQAQRQTRTVGGAIDEYERFLLDDGHKQATETIRRCRSFFVDDIDNGIASLTPKRCATIYAALTKRKRLRREGKGGKFRTVKTDKSLSATTQRGMYTHAKTFLKWCVKQRWLKANPLEAVEPRGKIKRGKPQLRIDEARKWLAKALELAPKEPGAVAALCALLLGMRATEITQRQVRDLDDDGRLLWIPESKTEAGRRTVEVPEMLRPLLHALAAGRAGDALLFGSRFTRVGGQATSEPHLRGWPLFWTKKIAGLAGVPPVSAHSMRGLFASTAARAGTATHIVAATLGHASEAVTLGNYVQPGAVAEAGARATLRVLDGGKRR